MGDVLRVRAASQLPGTQDAIALLLTDPASVRLQMIEHDAVADMQVWHAPELPPEAYTLRVNEQGVEISAASDAGVFYALQTLRQLLPADAFKAAPVSSGWQVPALLIEDAPRFSWRGMHLDVARHFMPVSFVKKFIDVMAMHKFNTFHWHLTDDQGWRVEIKAYPKLTGIGAQRAQTVVGFSLFQRQRQRVYDGKPHAGFYTQQEIREVVAYAAQRHITVVPEIEFPGHVQAALAAYPELGNTGASLKVKQEWGISRHTLNPSDHTLTFFRTVLTEILSLFPSRYIHIGGDEAPKGQWKRSAYAQKRIAELGLANEKTLQSWLVQQMADFLRDNGRTLIGWDEILQGSLVDGAAVMAWRGEHYGMRAARAGLDVVMAPTASTYFDYYQADASAEPLAIGSYLPLHRVYDFDPVPAQLEECYQERILGAQGQLWTEFMPVPEHVEYMAFPRAVALAEVLWSPPGQRNFSDFAERLHVHLKRLDALQVNYRAPGNDALGLAGRIRYRLTRALMGAYHWVSDL